MTLVEAIQIARQTLFEHHNLSLIDHEMYGHDKDSRAAAEAYNRLAKVHPKIEKICKYLS